MIKKLTQKDNEEVMEYLKQEPEFNLFIIGDIEAFGYETDFQQIWAEYDHGKVVAVLLQYRGNLVYYSDEDRSVEPFIEIMNDLKFEILNGKKEAIQRFEPYLKSWNIKDMYFASMRSFTKENIDTANVKIIDSYDLFCDEWELLTQIEEFSSGGRGKKEEYSKHAFKTSQEGFKTTYYLSVDNKMVSVASTVAECSVNAMIIGVATLEEHRKKGHASVLMNKLCDDYLNGKEKSLCLFYDNPKAGKIYQRLGFENIGMYRMYDKKKTK